MLHKAFLSYKYSEALELRDRIKQEMGDDVVYYEGDTSESPEMSDLKTQFILCDLTNLIAETSVTIVIISPKMKDSKWMDWEVEHCLRKLPRKGRTSRRNGVVGVIMKYNGDYGWFKYHLVMKDLCRVAYYHESKVYDIIRLNRYNQRPVVPFCDTCHCINGLTGSYITYVEEDEFLAHYPTYINNAHMKSENDARGYDITLVRYEEEMAMEAEMSACVE